MPKQSRNDSDPECIEWLREQGLTVEEMYLSSFERWKTRGPRSFDPKTYSLENDPVLQEFRIRDKFIRKFGFAILSQEGIEAIRPYAPLVELGAGSGYWSYELQKAGIDIIATDTLDEKFGCFMEEAREPFRWQQHYTEVKQLNSVEAVRRYPKRNLLIVWPSLNDPWAAEALDIFTGKVVIYMGEGHGNATADDRFHELLDQQFANQKYVRMPHFEHSYDRGLLICKKPKQLTGRKT